MSEADEVQGGAVVWLLAVDGSPSSLAAVRHALRVSDGAPRRFVLVNVQEPATLYEVVRTHDADELARIRRDAGADLLRQAEALLEAAGADYECEVAGGAPEHLIVELAERYGCDAIAMGAHGQDTAPAPPTGLGPVALAVLQASPVPVTIVRAAEATAAPEAG